MPITEDSIKGREEENKLNKLHSNEQNWSSVPDEPNRQSVKGGNFPQQFRFCISAIGGIISGLIQKHYSPNECHGRKVQIDEILWHVFMFAGSAIVGNSFRRKL